MISLDQLESAINLTIPSKMRALYDYSGDSSRLFRLLTPDEARLEYERYSRVFQLHGSAPFWKSIDHTRVFLYLAGPLCGRIYYWFYDGRHTSIAYRSIDSFQGACNEVSDITELPVSVDYFADNLGRAEIRAASMPEIQSDLSARSQLVEEWNRTNRISEYDDQHYSFNFMALTPKSHAQDIIEFVDSHNLYIASFACGLIGEWRLSDHIPLLARIVNTRPRMVVLSAIWALAKIGGSRAKSELEACATRLDKSYSRALEDALRKCA
jgi:hypothetical protein